MAVYPILASDDDATWDPFSWEWKNSENSICFCSDEFIISWLRFAIPLDGETILTAKLTFHSFGNYSDDCEAAICLIDEDDCPSFPNGVGDPFDVTEDWVAYSVQNWVENGDYDSPSLVDIIQAFIDRPGYVPGNHIGLAIADNMEESKYGLRCFDSFDQQGGVVAILTITTGVPAPTAPTGLLCEGETNPTGVIDLTPEFSAILNHSQPGATLSHVYIEVGTSEGLSDMWDSGWIDIVDITEGNRCEDISYNGIALSLNGLKYYWRIKAKDDNGVEGSWSSNAEFTMWPPIWQICQAPNVRTYPWLTWQGLSCIDPMAPTGLLCEQQTNPTGVDDLTPEFSGIFDHTDPNATGDYYQIQVNTASDFSGTVMWDSGKTTMPSVAKGERCSDISYAGTVLSLDGSKYYWRIKFWDNNDNASPWSTEEAHFTMKFGDPTAPTGLLCEGETNPTGVMDLTPEFSAIFNHTDVDATGEYYQIQVNTVSDFSGTEMWDSGKSPMVSLSEGARCPDVSYAGTTLSRDGSKYYWRIKFWDNSANQSPWSEE